MARMRRACSYVFAAAATALTAGALAAQAPGPLQLIPGPNTNMAGGEQTLQLAPDFRVRGDVLGRAQNEPSCTFSTRNPEHVLCAANDYRMVDVPGVTTTEVIRDAWQGNFQSVDGGATWESTLHPGFFLDPAPHILRDLGFRAAADPIVRAGPAGLAFVGGIAFTGQNDKDDGAVFVSTFIDLNNRENDRMPFKFVRTVLLDRGNAGQFIDKPWLFVEAAPGTTCTFEVPNPGGAPVAQTVPGSIVHAMYTVFVGNTDVRTKILYTKSTDCGATFGPPMKVNESNVSNQGATIARSLAGNGLLYGAWRRARFVADNGNIVSTDALMTVVSADNGQTWSKPAAFEICPFDQNTAPNAQNPTSITFRTTAFPTLTVDASGRAYVAWADRGRLADGTCNWNGKARIRVATSTTGTAWTVSEAVPSITDEHQIFPSIAFTAGKLFLAWVDFRDDASQIFTPRVDEKDVLLNPPPIRHTGDIFAAMAEPGAAPDFAAETARMSRYIHGVVPGTSTKVQLQWNAVNKRWARKGTVPFDGDYIDIATLPYLAPDWTPNTSGLITVPGQAEPVPVTPNVLIAWTDNRDMRRVRDETLAVPVPYLVPGGIADLPDGGASIFDPTQTRNVCTLPLDAYKTGATNQNTYAAPASLGVQASSPGNNKDLGGDSGGLQRAFVVVVRNSSGALKTFRLRISPLAGGVASFHQFDPSHTSIPALLVPRYSSVARTVFVSRDPASGVPLDPNATVRVDVDEIVGTAVVQTAAVYLNSDPSAPEIDSPEIDSPEIDSVEIYTPEIDSPEIDSPEIDSHGFPSPEIDSPEIDSPEIDSTELLSLGLQRPEIDSPEIDSPEIDSPEIDSPEIDSPEIDSPEIDSTAITDATFKITNKGNTTAQYNVKAFVSDAAAHGVHYQVIVRRQYFVSTVDNNCVATTVPLSKVAVNIPHPEIDSPEIDSPEIDSPEIDSAALDTASFAVAPGETVDLVIRTRSATEVTGAQLASLVDAVEIAVQQEAVNSDEAAAGITEPPVFTTWLTIATTALPAGVTGTAYSYQLRASGGLEPLTWSVLSGTLPTGLTVDPFGLISGTPTAAGTYTFTVQVQDSSSPEAQSASRTFSLTVTTAGVASLAFVTQPSDVVVDEVISPAVSVRAVDTTGAVIPGLAVTLALGTNPTDATLSGTLTKLTGATGVAIFDDLSLDRTGIGFTLIASADEGVLSATSAAFDVVSAGGTTFVVSNTSDSGTGSLRQAILDANANIGFTDTISFSLPGAGPYVIAPTSALPSISDPVIIDGTTQPGYAGTPIVELNGAGAGASDGFFITAGSSTVRGLVINRFADNGIQLEANGSNLIEGNYIGTDPSGTMDLGNGNDGVFISNSPENTIGGTITAARNVISGNASRGLRIFGQSATGNLVQGNFIGTTASGTAALGNAVGVSILGSSQAQNTLIGGPTVGARNVISANSDLGIQIATSNNNIVQGNYIGTDVTGTVGLGNAIAFPGSGAGITIGNSQNTMIGGTEPGAGNLISANGSDGLRIAGASGNVVQGNFIGTNAAGTAALGNTFGGVFITGAPNNTIGGTSAGAGNVISGNAASGVRIASGSGGNLVQGNYIGTDVSGTLDRGNGGNGVHVVDAPTNTIGGPTSSARNVISGNTGEGVRIDGAASTGNVIQGNSIGTNATETGPLGNSASGVYIRRAPGNFVIGNTIVNNLGFAGVAICGNVGGFCGGSDAGTQTNNGNGNAVHGNFINNNLGIGASLDGVANTLLGSGGGNNISGNGANGVLIFGVGATGNQIASNAINSNTGDGVQIVGAANTGNRVQGNSFINNTDLAIDLGGNGVTANDAGDADSGPNNLQNFPVITSASTTLVTGTLNSTSNTTLSVQLFVNATCDTSGHGEGQTLVSTFDVTTDGSGNVGFTRTGLMLNLGDQITGTATDPMGNTSEFSQCRTVTAPPPPVESLTFEQQPSSTTTGNAIVPPVQVRALDAGGAPVVGTSVSLELGPAFLDTLLAGSQQVGFALDPVRRRVYVTNNTSNNVSVFDADTGATIATVPTAPRPIGIAVDPNTNRIYVANWIFGYRVSVIDGDSLMVVQERPGGIPRVVAIDPALNHLYVGYDDGTVEVFDPATLNEVGVFSIGATVVSGIAVNQQTHRVYVQGSNGVLTVADGNTYQILATVPSASGSIAVNETTNRIYVVDGVCDCRHVVMIDGATNQVLVNRNGVAKGTIGIAIDPTTNQVYVSSYFDNVLVVLDGDTLDTKFAVPGGGTPTFVGFDGGAKRVYVGDQFTGAISVFNVPQLGGTTNAVTNASGIATFANLTVPAPGTGYELRASAGTPSLVSTMFDVGRPASTFAVTSPGDSFCGEKLAVGDINQDGDVDVVITDLCGTPGIHILPGDGAGGFGASTSLDGQTRALALGDLNGDGFPDIVSADDGIGDVFLSDGSGGFTQTLVTPLNESIQIGDVNGDGSPDLVSVEFFGNTVSVLLNDGSGNFSSAMGSPITVGSAPRGLVMGDLDADGKLDLVVERPDADTITILLGNGDGTFQETASPIALEGLLNVPQSATPLALADLNGDGKLDLGVTAEIPTGFYILRGNGDGTFTTMSPGWVSLSQPIESLAFADLNGDGKLDLIGIGDFVDFLTILPGNGDGTFGVEVQIPLGTELVGPTGLSHAIGDLNNDGRPDVVLGEEEGDFLILLNTTGSP